MLCSIRRQVNERVAKVAEEQGDSEGQRMMNVRRSAMLESARLYHDLASTIGSTLTDLVRKRRQLDQNTHERAHITAALETTTNMTTRKNLREQEVHGLVVSVCSKESRSEFMYTSFKFVVHGGCSRCGLFE